MCRVGVNNYIICRRLYVHVCEYAIRKRCVFNKVLKEKAKKHSEYSREFSILREQLRKDPKISLRKPMDCCRSQKISLCGNFQLSCSFSLSNISGLTHKQINIQQSSFNSIDIYHFQVMNTISSVCGSSSGYDNVFLATVL